MTSDNLIREALLNVQMCLIEYGVVEQTGSHSIIAKIQLAPQQPALLVRWILKQRAQVEGRGAPILRRTVDIIFPVLPRAVVATALIPARRWPRTKKGHERIVVVCRAVCLHLAF